MFESLCDNSTVSCYLNKCSNCPANGDKLIEPIQCALEKVNVTNIIFSTCYWSSYSANYWSSYSHGKTPNSGISKITF